MAFCPFHEDRDATLCIEYKPSSKPDLYGSLPRVYVACGVCQGDKVVPPPLGSDQWRKVNADTVAEHLGLEPNLVYRDQELLGQHCRADVSRVSLPDAAAVDWWHTELMAYVDIPEPLYARGLTEATLRRYQLGWNKLRSRYALPAWDEGGDLASVRYWSPTEKPKYLGLAGCPVVIYPSPAVPSGAAVVVCEGEFDCLLLRQHGFTAVTSTGGKGGWRQEWASLLEGRHVAFLYDTDAHDDALRDARVAEPVATSVRVVRLPLPGAKEDVTDWFVTHGRSAADLRAVINRSSPLGRAGGGGRG